MLKRLTGGAEFCSDAHRKRYQEEFNDLALSRLLLTQPPPPAKPLPSIEPEPEPEPDAPAIAAGPVLVPAAATPKVSSPERVAARKNPTAPPAAAARSANSPAKQAQKAPEPADPVVGMLGYIVEQPVSGDAERIVTGGEPPFSATIAPALPSRVFAASASATENTLRMAKPVALEAVIEIAAGPVRYRGGNLEIREFSRQAIALAVSPQKILHTSKEIAPSSALGEAMEITNQPHPPADQPVIWQAGPQPTPPIEVVLGELGRAEYGIVGFGEDLPGEAPRRTQPVFQNAAPVPLPSPKAAPSIQTPEAMAPEPVATPWTAPAPVTAMPSPAAESVPEAVTKPLPVTLHGSGTGAGKPVSIVSGGVPVSIEPQLPIASALPLRPRMILAPRPVAAPVPEPQPVVAQPASQQAPATPSPAVVANSSAVRPLRGPNGKNRRPEVRVVQAGPVPPRPVEAAPVPSARPAATVAPAVRPPAPPPVVSSPAPSPVAKAPAPIAKSNQVRSTLIAADAPSEPSKSASKPEIDLHLPELHNPEVAGPWARMPVALKAGIGAVLALSIIGFAYSALNSKTASATTSASANAGPAYNLGKQINSGGWIEDWAPTGSQRRITLLRGSQPYSDYRIEFAAQIQKKAVGWMYRALNPKNYYVVKLEALKPGIDPVVALVRYAVIDGKNEGRVEKILPMKVRVDTTYKVRFDAVGPAFTAWVQGQKVDEWRDTRLGSGGIGLYSEGEESAEVHGTMNVFELVSTK